MSKRTVRHREDGPSRAYYVGLGVGSEPGEELTLDEDDAAYLVEKGDHDYVGDADAVESESESSDASDSEADDGDEDDDEDVTESGYAANNYSREELDAMEYSDLQSLASQSDHPDVDGRSSRADIIDAFADE